MKKVKPIEPMGMEMPMKSEKYYPTLHVDFKTLPEAKSWRVGNTYRVEFELKQTSMDMHESKHGEGGGAGFEIRGVKVLKGEAKTPRYK